MRRAVALTLTSLCALFLLGCGCSPLCPATYVTYEVTGETSYVSVEYNNDYGDNEYSSSVALPWVKKFSVKYRSNEYYGGIKRGETYLAYLSATVTKPNGYITVRIYVDGKLVKEKSTKSTTDMSATIFYSVN